MIFRQLFDPESSGYTYLLAAGAGGEALLIDPVLARVESSTCSLLPRPGAAARAERSTPTCTPTT